MGKAKAAAGEQRRSVRLATKPQKPLGEIKTRKPSAAKKGPKQKKAKPAENGQGCKAEEPKAEATEAK